MKGLFNYIKDSFKELRSNVTWPTWKELQGHTGLVLIATIIFALLIFAFDYSANLGLSLVY